MYPKHIKQTGEII